MNVLLCFDSRPPPTCSCLFARFFDARFLGNRLLGNRMFEWFGAAFAAAGASRGGDATSTAATAFSDGHRRSIDYKAIEVICLCRKGCCFDRCS